MLFIQLRSFIKIIKDVNDLKLKKNEIDVHHDFVYAKLIGNERNIVKLNGQSITLKMVFNHFSRSIILSSKMIV